MELGGVWLPGMLADCSHSVNTTGNCLMRADIRISLPLKNFWLGCSWIMWIRLCALWGPEGKIGMTSLPVLGNNCCLDKGGQGCLLILSGNSEWTCWLLQCILWKNLCSSISGSIKQIYAMVCCILSCLEVLWLGVLLVLSWSRGHLSRMTSIVPGENHWSETSISILQIVV